MGLEQKQSAFNGTANKIAYFPETVHNKADVDADAKPKKRHCTNWGATSEVNQGH